MSLVLILALLPRGVVCPVGWEQLPVSGKCAAMSNAGGVWGDARPCTDLDANATIAVVEDKRDVDALKALQWMGWMGIGRAATMRADFTNIANDLSVWNQGLIPTDDNCVCLYQNTVSGCPCTTASLIYTDPSCTTSFSINGICFEITATPDKARTFPTITNTSMLLALSAFLQISGTQHAIVSFRKQVYSAWSSLGASYWDTLQPMSRHDLCAFIGSSCPGGLCATTCSTAIPHVCEYSNPVCGATMGEVLLGTTCYYVTPTSQSFDPTFCSGIIPGAQAATFAVDATHLTQLRVGGYLPPEAWTGISKLSDNAKHWAWPSRQSGLQLTWAPGFPTNAEGCAIFHPDGTLKEVSCGSSYNSVCITPFNVTCGGIATLNDCYEFQVTLTTSTMVPCELVISTQTHLFNVLTMLKQRGASAWVSLRNMELRSGWAAYDATLTPQMESLVDWSMISDSTGCAFLAACDELCLADCSTSLRSICALPLAPTPAPTPVPTPAPTPAPTHTLAPTFVPAVPTMQPLQPPIIPLLPPDAPVQAPAQTPALTPALISGATPTETSPANSGQPEEPTVTSTVAVEEWSVTAALLDAAPTVPNATYELPKDIGQVVTAISVTGVLGAFASPSSTIYGTQLGLVLYSACQPNSDSILLHPTKLVIEGSYELGAVVGNLAILCFISIAQYVATLIHAKLRKSDLHKSQGILLQPSGSVLAFLFLYQGTVFCSVRLLFKAGVPWWAHVVGALGSCICLGVPVWYTIIVMRVVPSKARYIWDEETKGVVRGILGPGEWISLGDREENRRYLSALKQYNEKTIKAGMGLYCVMMVGLALCNVKEDRSLRGCGDAKLFSGLLYAMWGALLTYLRPYAVARDNVMEPAIYFCISGSLLCMAGGFYENTVDGTAFDVSSILVSIATALLSLKLGIDIICELYVICTSRRDRVQRNYAKPIREEYVEFLMSQEMAIAESTGTSLCSGTSSLNLYSWRASGTHSLL